MAGFRTTTHVEAHPDKVFEVFSDIPQTADRVNGITRIEMLTEGQVRVGTKWRETRVFFKKEATEEMEITELTPGKSYAVGAESHGMKYLTEFQFIPEGTGTRVETVFQATPMSIFAKIVSPFSGLMIAPVKKCVDQDIAELKDFVESSG